MKIIVDAMGGDNAPHEIIKGTIEALENQDGFDVILIGNENDIKEELKKYSYSKERISIVNATEKITGEDEPVKAIKGKKDSSIVKAFNMIKNNEADVMVSAGNSGALLTGCILILSRIKGVDRPALAAIMPAKNGCVLLLDAGANASCKPETLLKFGVMGSIYMKDVLDIENPKIGLLNIGAEESKGNELYKQAYQIFADSYLNFVGNVEGDEVISGKADIVVCDGFTGNIVLKFYEGLGSYMLGILKGLFFSSVKSKISALLVKNSLKKIKKDLDPSEYGGAPFLGVNGKVLKSHGSSKAKDIRMTILKAYKYANCDIINKTQEGIKKL